MLLPAQHVLHMHSQSQAQLAAPLLSMPLTASKGIEAHHSACHTSGHGKQVTQ